VFPCNFFVLEVPWIHSPPNLFQLNEENGDMEIRPFTWTINHVFGSVGIRPPQLDVNIPFAGELQSQIKSFPVKAGKKTTIKDGKNGTTFKSS